MTVKDIQQTQQAKAFLHEKRLVFDHFYSSTQERASDTLELIIGGSDYKRLKGLKEMNFGSFEGERADLQPKGTQYFDSFYVQFGGEYADDVRKRMIQTLTTIMENPNHQNVLAVSHNGTCFYFLQSIWKDDERKIPFQFPNCSIFEYTYEHKQFSINNIIDPSTGKSIL